MVGLPDPEMRKFLLHGNVERVRLVLSPHINLGMNLSFNEEEGTFTIGITDLEEPITLPINQQLKLSVKAANAVMGG